MRWLFIIGCVVMAAVMVLNYRLHANGTYTRWSIEQHGEKDHDA